MDSDIVLRRDRPLRVVDGDLNASTRKGGIFSLLLSPSSMVAEDLKRFDVGVDAGVGRCLVSASSRGDVAGGEVVSAIA